MNRSICGFHLDGESHWVAELVCGHFQHTRHDPPISERAWVLTEQGRASRIGTPLDCRRCDRGELPDGYAPSHRTPEFTEDSVPAGLLRDHSTKPGVWGRIHVIRGHLDYHVQPPLERHEVLTPESPGVVAPEVKHCVACPVPVAFYVEFWKPGAAAATPSDDPAS